MERLMVTSVPWLYLAALFIASLKIKKDSSFFLYQFQGFNRILNLE